MKIKNPNLANTTLRVGTDDLAGDADGVFDVPDKTAEMLLQGGVWQRVKKGGALPAAPEAPVDPTGGTEPPAAPQSDEGGDADEVEEVDLEVLTKAELVALADEQGIELDPRANKSEIKAAIEDALGGG